MIVEDFTEWLSNGRTPWSVYQDMTSGRLIALDKKPGIIPVGVRETWRRLMAKCLIWVTG